MPAWACTGTGSQRTRRRPFWLSGQWGRCLPDAGIVWPSVETAVCGIVNLSMAAGWRRCVVSARPAFRSCRWRPRVRPRSAIHAHAEARSHPRPTCPRFREEPLERAGNPNVQFLEGCTLEEVQAAPPVSSPRCTAVRSGKALRWQLRRQPDGRPARRGTSLRAGRTRPDRGDHLPVAGEADDRQEEGARPRLASMVGVGKVCVVHILSREG